MTPDRPPLSCRHLVPSRDATDHCSVIRKLQYDVIFVGGDTVVREQGTEVGAEEATLLDTNVCGNAG